MMPTLEYHELEAMPTLHSGHFANLKIDTAEHGGAMRVWVSRCGLADGEKEPVSVEVLKGGLWTNPLDDVPEGRRLHLQLDAGRWRGYTVVVFRRMDGAWNQGVR